MKKTIIFCGLLLLYAFGLSAQTAETIPFLALMESKNEVPPVPETHSGNVIIWVHVIRDAQGNITSGSVDFDVSTRFAGAVSFAITSATFLNSTSRCCWAACPRITAWRSL